jgi:hypothetical protein
MLCEEDHKCVDRSWLSGRSKGSTVMTDIERTSELGAKELRNVRILQSRGLLAEYTTGQAPSGEWFALGSVRSEVPLTTPPAWILVGTGPSAEEAVGGLMLELESEARRIIR